MKKYILPLCCLAALSLTSSLHAAFISFSTPQTIAGDSDIITTGSFVYAYTESGTPSNINGVNFSSGGPSKYLGPGDVTFSQWPDYGSGAGPLFPNLSAEYRNLLSSAAGVTGGDFIVTLGNLMVGQSYQFQLWCHDASGLPQTIRNVDGSGAVSLYRGNHDGSEIIAMGQYTIGTFTADSTSQSFEILVNNLSTFNAIQLRTIPEPGCLALLGLAGIATILRRRRA